MTTEEKRENVKICIVFQDLGIIIPSNTVFRIPLRILQQLLLNNYLTLLIWFRKYNFVANERTELSIFVQHYIFLLAIFTQATAILGKH